MNKVKKLSKKENEALRVRYDELEDEDASTGRIMHYHNTDSSWAF